jgi:hypothetical protein
MLFVRAAGDILVVQRDGIARLQIFIVAELLHLTC